MGQFSAPPLPATVLLALCVGRIAVHWVLRTCIAGQIAGAMLLWFGVSVGLVVIGLACAPIFPTLIAATPDRLRKMHVANTVGFQITAAVFGQSLWPAMTGVLARNWGLEVVTPVLLIAAVLLLTLHEALLAVAMKTPQAATA